MEAKQKLKFSLWNNIIINFTLEEISTPLDDLHVPQPKRLHVKPLTGVTPLRITDLWGTEYSELTMVSSLYSESSILSGVTHGVIFFLLGSEGCNLIVDPRNRPDTGSIVSAMKIYTTLKKISTKTVYYEKS